MTGYRCIMRISCLAFITLFLVLAFVGYQVLSEETEDSNPERSDELTEEQYQEPEECPNIQLYASYYHEIVPYIDSFETLTNPRPQDIDVPIILWWTQFTKEQGSFKRCGKLKCYFTEDRNLRNFPQPKAIMFYGTDFNYLDLPHPRSQDDLWALLHEESPHNVWMLSHLDALSLFNLTSTFRRESDYPIATQYLGDIEELESTDFLVPTSEKSRLIKEEGFALFNYVQSDCGALSDRDHFVQMLQRHLAVDSYGACEHNKDLPERLRDPIEGMIDEEFLNLLAKYKFTLAFENSVCDDYMTEKFWRPFVVGSVPIIFGSSKAKEFFPTNQSAIFVEDFKSVEELVELIKYLDENDEEYGKYLSFKKPGGVTNDYLRQTISSRDWDISNSWEKNKPNFIEGFQCYVCKYLHSEENNQKTKTVRIADINHYGCPEPKKFVDNPPGNLSRVNDPYWASAWSTGKYMAMALRYYLDNNISNYTENDFMEKTIELHNIHESSQVSFSEPYHQDHTEL